MIDSETLVRVRTYPYNSHKGVYFVFRGILYLDNLNTISPLSTFVGFNYATRLDNNEITSYEYVVFSNSNINPIWNPEVNFTFPEKTNYPSLTYDYTTTSLSIPVNREGYRALEHFCFMYKLEDLDKVSLSWSRFSEPRLPDQKLKNYRWIYSANGYKTFILETVQDFPNFDFKLGKPVNLEL